jgi:predicted N-acyltransferase
MVNLSPAESTLPNVGEVIVPPPLPGTTDELQTKIFTRIEDISPEKWQKLFPGVLEGYYFLKSLDESNLEQFKFYYVAVYCRETLVGAAPCYSMNYSLEIAMQGKPKDLACAIKKIFPGFLSLKALICGVPMGAHGRIGVLDRSHEVFSAIISGMERIARDNKIRILAFKDFGAEDQDLLDTLQRQGFYKFKSMPSTDMQIDFKDFEDYLMKLDKSKRADLRRKFKKADSQIKLDLEVTNDLGGMLDEAYELFSQTEARGGIQFEKLSKDFFARISKNMPGETKYFLWRINQKIVAVSFCQVSGDYFVGHYVGFDYEIAHQYHLFFMRFRDLMNWCIQNKITRYEMGSTSYSPKKTLGFKLVPLFAYAKHLDPWINPFFKLICKLFKPENFEEVLREPKERSS